MGTVSLTIDMPLYEPTFRIADKEVTAYSEAELTQFMEAFAAQEKRLPHRLVLIFQKRSRRASFREKIRGFAAGFR